MPKQLHFGELIKTCPRLGSKRLWRNLAVMDIWTLGIKKIWFKIAYDGKQFVNRLAMTLEKFVLLQDHLQLKIFACLCGRYISAVVFWRSVKASMLLWQTNLDHEDLHGALHFSLFLWRVFHMKGDLTRHLCFCKAT